MSFEGMFPYLVGYTISTAIEPLLAYTLVPLSSSLPVFKCSSKQESYGSRAFLHTVVTLNFSESLRKPLYYNE